MLVSTILWVVATLVASTRASEEHAASVLRVEHHEIIRRYDYRQALKKPFFLHGDTSNIPYYTMRGHTIAAKDQVRLTSSLPNQAGQIWVSNSNPHKEWQLHFSFSVFGRNQIGGEGLALWYTKDKEQSGPIYGSMDKWNGLGIFFDTADQRENRVSPLVYGVLNDGHYVMDGRGDYMSNSMGSCFRDYRNTPSPVWGRLTYANRTLRLDMDLRQDGYSFTQCFEKTDIDLPQGYHFGFSASTSEYHYDDHDLLSLEVFEVNPKSRPGMHADEEVDADTKKRIEHMQRLLKEQEEADLAAINEEKQSNEVVSPHALQHIEENQYKMIEAMNILYDKIGEVPIAAAGHNNVHDSVSKLHRSMEELSHKLDQTNEKLERVKTDLTSFYNRLNQESSRNDASMRHVATELRKADEKLDKTHKAIEEKASSHHSIYSFTYFLLGGIIVYAMSVIYRSLTKPDKKFI